MGDEVGDEVLNNNEVAPALLALDPDNTHVVMAVGTELRVFNLQSQRAVAIKEITTSSGHQDAIKAIGFNKEGNMFVSAGDDKLVKLWDTKTWSCSKTSQTHKKVSAAAFSYDNKWIVFADKFGVVYTISTRAEELDPPVQLLAHCCSIITSLECCMDGTFIVTSDRDFKIRVSLYPKEPLKGAHEIQGFCLGHTSFVSCMALFNEDYPASFLVSGGGDGTVRLWELNTTQLLDTFYVGNMVGLLGRPNNEEREAGLVVTCISISRDGAFIAVGVESLDGVVYLRSDLKTRKLSFLQQIELGESFCPTSMQFDERGRLWMVAGAAEKLAAGEQRAVSILKVISSTNEPSLEVMNDDSIPGGALLLETFQGNAFQSDSAHALADAANATMKTSLSKRHYSLEYREIRKQMRNDRKMRRGVLRVQGEASPVCF